MPIGTAPRLWLIEDVPDKLSSLAVLLRTRYEVLTRSPPDAVSALDDLKPDVLLLDIGLTPRDAAQCLETIRARPEYHDVPAIALCAFAREAEPSKFYAGFQAFVTKPIFLAELVAVVDALLKRPSAADPPPE